jgi:hypothetical protein
MITADVMHSGTDTTLGWDMMLLAMILLILAALFFSIANGPCPCPGAFFPDATLVRDSETRGPIPIWVGVVWYLQQQRSRADDLRMHLRSSSCSNGEDASSENQSPTNSRYEVHVSNSALRSSFCSKYCCNTAVDPVWEQSKQYHSSAGISVTVGTQH